MEDYEKAVASLSSAKAKRQSGLVLTPAVRLILEIVQDDTWALKAIGASIGMKLLPLLFATQHGFGFNMKICLARTLTNDFVLDLVEQKDALKGLFEKGKGLDLPVPVQGIPVGLLSPRLVTFQFHKTMLNMISRSPMRYSKN